MKESILVRNYRGVDVFVSTAHTTRFYAEAAGTRHWGGSFETLRKKLDVALGFDPFDALTITRDGVEQVRIVGVDMEGSQWCLETGGHTHGGTRINFYNYLYPLTMRAALETYLGDVEEWDKQEEAIKEARTTERQRIESLGIARPDK